MRDLLLIVILSWVFFSVKAQTQDRILLINVKDKSELVKAIRYLKQYNPEMICINIDLFRCDNFRIISTAHLNPGDTLGIEKESSLEIELSGELESVKNLLLPSKVRRWDSHSFRDVVGCKFLYPRGVKTGFINLIKSSERPLRADSFLVSNNFHSQIAYHFGVQIAMKINANKVQSLMMKHPGSLPILNSPKRKFASYDFSELYGKEVHSRLFQKKIIVIGANKLTDCWEISNGRRMTSSEIFANIACQLIDD